MLRLDKVIKPWKDSAALNDHINLYGFWSETAFLTKSGDLGMVLSVPGVDYESLDRSEQEYAVKRLRAALKAFGPGFHVYQYLFKSNRPDIPFATYDDPIVEAATIHANSAEKALHRFANLVMRSHAQSTFADTEAEIAEAVDFVVHVERQPGRRVVREVLALRGYDRDAKRFLIDAVFEVQHATASARSAAPIAAGLLTNSAQEDSLIPLPIKENQHATA